MDDINLPLPCPPALCRRRRAWTKRLAVALGINQRLVQKLLKSLGAPDWSDDQVEADFDAFETAWRRFLGNTWPRFRGLRPALTVDATENTVEPPKPPDEASGGTESTGFEGLQEERLAKLRAERQVAELKLAQLRGSLLPRAKTVEMLRTVLLITAGVVRDHPAWLAEALPAEHRAPLRAVARTVEARAIAELKAKVKAQWEVFIRSIEQPS